MLLKKFKAVERRKLIDILNIDSYGTDWALKEVKTAIDYCNPEHYKIIMDYKEYKIPGSMLAGIYHMSLLLENDDYMYEAFGCLLNVIRYCPEHHRKKYLSVGETLCFLFALQGYAQKAKSLPPNTRVYDRKTTSLYTPFFSLGCKNNDVPVLGYVGSIHGKLSKPTYPNNLVENGK